MSQDHPDPNDNRFTYFDHGYEGVLGTRPNGDTVVMRDGIIFHVHPDGSEAYVDCRAGHRKPVTRTLGPHRSIAKEFGPYFDRESGHWSQRS